MPGEARSPSSGKMDVGSQSRDGPSQGFEMQREAWKNGLGKELGTAFEASK